MSKGHVKVATAAALQRTLQRVRNLEGDLRDLRRELDDLKGRMSTVRAFVGGVGEA